jgi:hypothetical protein
MFRLCFVIDHQVVVHEVGYGGFFVVCDEDGFRFFITWLTTGDVAFQKV